MRCRRPRRGSGGRDRRSLRLIPARWGLSCRRPSWSAGSAMCGERRRGPHLRAGRNPRRRRRTPRRRRRRTPRRRRRRRRHNPRRRWRRRWRRWRGAQLEDQPGSVLRIAEPDRPAVMDEHRGHPHAVDVDAAFAPVDGNPLPAVVMQHHMGGRRGCTRAVHADIRSTVQANGHVSAGGKGVPIGSEPDNQGGSECFRRHSHHLPRPSSWVE